jgi:predicted anti-sigma-YlaC factor YlaD
MTLSIRPRLAPLLVAGATLFLYSGCSIKGMAIRQLGKALSEGTGSAFAEESDLKFAGEAVPFSLKLVESLLHEQPDNADLLLAAASGFTQYCYVWVQQPADFLESEDFAAAQAERERARAFYLRAHRYARRALDAAHPHFAATFARDPNAGAALLGQDQVPLMYWAAASLGGAVSLSKTDPAMIARQPEIEALLDRASALDPDWSDGALHELHMAYETVRPGVGPEGVQRVREHFARAIDLQDGKRASPFVSLAESISVQEQNRAEFINLLERALAIDPERTPANRLGNIAMQERARWLLDRVDELFLE